jgi:membrane-associated protease RseP (regulator of RpoE activity)
MRGKKFTFALMLGGLLLPAVSMFALPQPGNEQFSHGPDGFFFSPGRSYLGVDIQDVTPERVSELKLKEERGVEVTMVDQDAPAGKAGLKEHDVILEFNGTKVESGEQLRRLIRETPSGRGVTLGISREGNPMTVNVQLADRGKMVAEYMPQVIMPKNFEMPEVHFPSQVLQMRLSPILGIQAEGVGRQLGEYFGIKDGEGLLIKSVEKGGPAEKAGLKAGDVIVRTGDEKVTDRSDLSRILRTHRTGGKVALTIVRDHKEQTISVDVPERKVKDSSRMHIEVPDIDINLDEIHSNMDEIQGVVKKITPEMEHMRQQIALELRPQIEEAMKVTRQITPEVKKAMEKAQEEVRRVQKQLQELDSRI